MGDRLAAEFGRDNLCLDVDNIPLGVNFAKFLSSEVSSCDVLLAVIGPRWLELRDDEGRRRIDDPNDFVRIEIGAALKRDIPVIPILIDGTRIAKAETLPADLQELSLRHGLELRHSTFHPDLNRLVRELRALATSTFEMEASPTEIVVEQDPPSAVAPHAEPDDRQRDEDAAFYIEATTTPNSIPDRRLPSLPTSDLAIVNESKYRPGRWATVAIWTIVSAANFACQGSLIAFIIHSSPAIDLPLGDLRSTVRLLLLLLLVAIFVLLVVSAQWVSAQASAVRVAWNSFFSSLVAVYATWWAVLFFDVHELAVYWVAAGLYLVTILLNWFLREVASTLFES
ncbi:hypothetical protein ACE103_06490 [Bradyrhizobium sp. ma5]|uniref:hypothetical protein n=1 Tax=Bradyrhizobium sp. ma5 TaxID=3344828 RepID=UPI0035D3FF01